MKRLVGYWTATGFFAVVMGVSGGLALSHSRGFAHALAHLGYPSYFGSLLGVGKLLGVAVLLAPGAARWKEWAYAAFGVVVVSAAYSHFQSGDGLLRALEPLLVAGTTLVISYRLRPPARRGRCSGTTGEKACWPHSASGGELDGARRKYRLAPG